MISSEHTLILFYAITWAAFCFVQRQVFVYCREVLRSNSEILESIPSVIAETAELFTYKPVAVEDSGAEIMADELGYPDLTQILLPDVAESGSDVGESVFTRLPPHIEKMLAGDDGGVRPPDGVNLAGEEL